MNVVPTFNFKFLQRVSSVPTRISDRLLLVHRGKIAVDVEGGAKRRLTPEDLASRFDRLRRADQLDDPAARTLRDLYA